MEAKKKIHTRSTSVNIVDNVGSFFSTSSSVELHIRVTLPLPLPLAHIFIWITFSAFGFFTKSQSQHRHRHTHTHIQNNIKKLFLFPDGMECVSLLCIVGVHDVFLLKLTEKDMYFWWSFLCVLCHAVGFKVCQKPKSRKNKHIQNYGGNTKPEWMRMKERERERMTWNKRKLLFIRSFSLAFQIYNYIVLVTNIIFNAMQSSDRWQFPPKISWVSECKWMWLKNEYIYMCVLFLLFCSSKAKNYFLKFMVQMPIAERTLSLQLLNGTDYALTCNVLAFTGKWFVYISGLVWIVCSFFLIILLEFNTWIASVCNKNFHMPHPNTSIHLVSMHTSRIFSVYFL